MSYKNIAVLMTALDTDAQAETLKGIEKLGKEQGYNIAVFLWFTGAYEREKHNLGEVNIAYLPDLNLFDGVIVFSNALHLDVNRNKLKNLLHNVTCPIVCIGDELDGCYSVCLDNYSSMRQLVEHFVKHHNMKKIHFVKGIEGNGDAEARYKAYVDVLTENGIPIVPERITFGDFYVTGGELAVKDVLNSSLPFPEVIVCANDVMALTVYDLLTEKGYRIPEDVCLSGYDCIVEGQSQDIKLTTVRSNLEHLGAESCRVLIDLINGKKIDRHVYVPDELVLGGTCGCVQSGDENNEIGQKVIAGMDVNHRKMFHHMLMHEKAIMEGDGYEDWSNALKTFISEINPREFYFCANDNFVEDVFSLDTMEQENVDVEEKLQYSYMSNVIIAYQNGMFKSKQPFESRYAFDDLFKDMEQPKLYIFSPMHYLDRTFGYYVFVDCSFTINNLLYVDWLISMSNSIENIRKQSLLKNAMARLDEMYIRDSLTSAYNRFGMERFFSDIKKKCLMSHVLLQISFVDIDGLKMINDEYGHEEGDRVISMSAKILQNNAGKQYVIRYGGDEFIVMGTVRSEKEVERYWSQVEKEVKKYNTSLKRQAEISISYGYELFNVGMETNLSDCIRIVDNKMYVVKNQKKMHNKQ